MADTTAQPEKDALAGLIDLPRLNDWLAQHDAPGSGPVTSAQKLAGGLQNNVFLIERGKFLSQRGGELSRIAGRSNDKPRPARK